MTYSPNNSTLRTQYKQLVIILRQRKRKEKSAILLEREGLINENQFSSCHTNSIIYVVIKVVKMCSNCQITV